MVQTTEHCVTEIFLESKVCCKEREILSLALQQTKSWIYEKLSRLDASF